MSKREMRAHRGAAGPPRWRAGVLTVALAAAGCAVNTYKPAVETFAGATGQASDAYAGMQAVVVAAHVESLRQRALSGDPRVQVRIVTGDCMSTSLRCRLALMGDAKPLMLNPELQNITLLLHGIAAYAANLRGIVNSDSAQQVNANLAAAGGSIANLAAAAGTAGSGAVNPAAFAAPTANLIGWVAGEYVNLLQVEALRKATREADRVIQEARVVLDGAAEAALGVAKEDQELLVATAMNEVRHGRTDRARLDRLVASAAAFDAVLTAPVADLFGDMAKAHRSLADSLDGRNVTVAAAYAAVQGFAAKADALYRLVEALRGAGKDGK